MSPNGSDRNLLFGLLAVQLEFVAQNDLIAAMNAWAIAKAKSLGQILVERGALSPADRALLDMVVEKHIERHGGDARESLAALRAPKEPTGPLTAGLAPEARSVLAGLPGVTPTVIQKADEKSVVSRYRSRSLHAQGGMGEVYLAHDSELGRDVALKELQGRFAQDPTSRARFIREAEITGRLEHPGIVPVYGFGCHSDGRPYYAMRFVEGETLREAVRRFHQGDGFGSDPGDRLLIRNRLLRRFVTVCEAVQYAHSKGIVHRDIKPGNVMLGPFGETLLVDWGLAKVIDGVNRPESEPAVFQTGACDVGQFVGTPQYASPEQAAGGIIAPASDIYSLGGTLYTILTNRGPVEEEGIPAALDRVRRGEFPRPTEVNPRVPKSLEAICLRAMALRPIDRYPTAKALAEDVERFLVNEPVSAVKLPAPISRSPSVRISVFTRTGLAASVTGAFVPGKGGRALAAGATFQWQSDPVAGPVEIGRRLGTGEAVFARSEHGGRTRFAVAGFESRRLISRRQAVIEPISPTRARVRNVSTVCEIRTADRGDLAAGEEREFALPVELLFPSHSILVDGPDGWRPTRVAAHPSDDTPLAIPTDEGLDRWIRGVAGLAGLESSDALFRETARCLTTIMRLSVSAVFLWRGGDWEMRVSEPESIGVSAWAEKALKTIHREKKTVWHTPTREEGGEMDSMADLTSYIAAPILNRNGEIHGAVYGEFNLSAVPTRRQIQMESMLFGLVAALLASRLTNGPPVKPMTPRFSFAESSN